MSYTKKNKPLKVFSIDELLIHIFSSREKTGAYAAKEVALCIKALLKNKEEVNIIFAAAPSQQEFIEHLIARDNIDWHKVNAFHMDEYLTAIPNSPQSFGTFLKERLFKKVPFKSVNYINGDINKIKDECQRYSKLLQEKPADIVCLGIGENGHIAFNEPNAADFNDPVLVKTVALELACRQQQVNENCFSSLNEVPEKAITVTIPALLKAKYMYCIVPAANKAHAVYKALHEAISEQCPASILRKKKNAKLYLDLDSSSFLKGGKKQEKSSNNY